jgi:hypothetical protein
MDDQFKRNTGNKISETNILQYFTEKLAVLDPRSAIYFKNYRNLSFQEFCHFFSSENIGKMAKNERPSEEG